MAIRAGEEKEVPRERILSRSESVSLRWVILGGSDG